jgi:RHS repeat-associated protein
MEIKLDAARCFAVLPILVTSLLAPAFGQDPRQPLAPGGLTVSTAPTIEPTRLPNTGPFSVPFTVTNNGSTTVPASSLSCIFTGPVTCGTVSPEGLPPLAPGASANATVTYSVTTVGSGSIGLQVQPDIGSPASKSRIVTVANAGKARPVFVNHNPDNIDRGMCLTVGAGEAAGVSCGDLFVTQTMPAFPTLGRDRAPTLYYNSAAATGLFLVAANLVEPTSIATPNTIRVFLTVGTSKDSAEYSPVSTYPYDQPLQIVIGRNLVAQPTGVYPMTLLVRNVYTGFSSLDTTITSTALVVNRSASEYGRGWSLLGVEQVLFDPTDSTRLVWLAGDGSIRLYRKPSPGSSVFQGAAGDAPDSLVRFDTLGVKWYRRDLRHGAAVRFDETGRHIETRNRTGQRTQFRWGSVAGQTRLTSVVLAPDTAKKYLLYWNSGTARLDSIVDPYARGFRASMTIDTLTRLVQASPFPSDDYDTTSFVYQGGRMIRRVSETSALTGGFIGTTFEYQNGARITKVKIPSGATGSDTAFVTFTAWDEKGLALAYAGQVGVLSSADTALPTRVDGPLSGTNDATDFWVNRFGSPIKTLQLGLSATTRIWRDSSASLPALVTRVQYPNNRITRMSWNGRGNLVEIRDSTKHVDSLPTNSTVYTYSDPNTPDSPTRSTDALGRHVDYTYTPLGLTDSVIDARGARTKFFYRAAGSLLGVVDSVADRAVETWWESTASEHIQDQVNRFKYDSTGNLIRWTSPLGTATDFTRDPAGRITDSYDPMGFRRHFVYDGFNRILSQEHYVTQQTPPGGGALELCEQNQIQCTQTFAPFVPASDFSTNLVTAYQYNDDGLASASDPRAVWRGFEYDVRGNRVKEKDGYDNSTTARARSYFNVAGSLDSTRTRMAGALVRYRYDAIGRRSAMLLTKVPDPDGVLADSVKSDSVSYTYDVMGNILVARNNLRTITRTYFADGSLRTQVSTDSNNTNDSLTFRYDVTGARTKLIRVRDGFTDSVAYLYAPSSGVLDSLLVWWGSIPGQRKVSFLWDQVGRRRQVTYPSGVTVAFRYDGGGLIRRIMSTNAANPSSSDRFDFEYRNDVVGPGGQIRHQNFLCPDWRTGEANSLGLLCGPWAQLQTTNQYSLFGMLTYQQRVRSLTEIDSMRYDRSGNLSYQRHTTETYPFSYKMAVATGDGSDSTNVLLTKKNVVTGATERSFAYTFDLGRRRETGGTITTYWYDALGRTSGIAAVGSSSAPNTCRYDPDGQMARACDSGAPLLTFEGANVGTASGWRFVSGPSTDDPLIGIHRGTGCVTTELYWITDGQGRQLAVGASDGGFSGTQQDCYRATGGAYAGGTQNAHTFGADRFGSANLPSFSFFRNRVYDQATGRWTQEDPIGVTGGLNLYQYVGNNPVAYTDPFGLQRNPLQPYPVCRGTAMCTHWRIQNRLVNERFTQRLRDDPIAQLAMGMEGGGARVRVGRLFRFGTAAEPVEKLAGEAARAEAAGFPHGVSTTTRVPTRTAASEASFEDVAQHFEVQKTGADPAHFTVVLPKPVTDAVANLFNLLFGRP